MKTIEEIKQELKRRIEEHQKNLNNGYMVSTIQVRQHQVDRALLTAINTLERIDKDDNPADEVGFCLHPTEAEKALQTIREQWGE